MGIRTVAVYSDADAKAMHVREADAAVHIGASAARESYLVGEKIIAAALATKAEAIHPGYGFLSENAEFAQAVIDAGLIWVGPAPASITAMGLKDAAKTLMAEAGVPVTPGYMGENQDPAFLAERATEIGYPVLIKASAGGGGKGMRRVDGAADFVKALEGAQREAAGVGGLGADHGAVGEADVIGGQIAKIGHVDNLALHGIGDALGFVGVYGDLLGTNRQIGLAAFGNGDNLAFFLSGVQGRFALGPSNLVAGAGAFGGTFDDIHVADEVGDINGVWRFIDRGGSGDLDDASFVHDCDPGGDSHRFFLIMGHDDKGGARFFLNIHQFKLRFFAQFLVESAQGLVQQEEFGGAGERAGQGHALALAPRNLVGFASGEFGQAGEAQHLFDAGFELVFGLAHTAQTKGDVFPDRKMREERIALEHHVHFALVGRDALHIYAADEDLAFGGLFKPGQHSHHRGFAAAGGAE